MATARKRMLESETRNRVLRADIHKCAQLIQVRRRRGTWLNEDGTPMETCVGSQGTTGECEADVQCTRAR